MCVRGGGIEMSRGKECVHISCAWFALQGMFACVHLRGKKMNEFSDRSVTWLECKSGCGCLLFSISPTQIVYRRDWKEAVCWMLWADIAWLRLPCVVADVSEAILFTCQRITTCCHTFLWYITFSVPLPVEKKIRNNASWLVCTFLWPLQD